MLLCLKIQQCGSYYSILLQNRRATEQDLHIEETVDIAIALSRLVSSLAAREDLKDALEAAKAVHEIGAALEKLDEGDRFIGPILELISGGLSDLKALSQEAIKSLTEDPNVARLMLFLSRKSED